MKMTPVFYMLVLLSLLTACDRREDTTPSFADRNVFEPEAGDGSVTAQIRREFYDTTGSYLLFTDTLQTVMSGTAADGSPVFRTELLDVMGYAMVGYGSTTKYDYDYITNPEDQEAAVRLVRDHLVWRMGKALPYAFLIVNGIKRRNAEVYETKLLGMRAYAISLSYGEAYTDPDTYFRSMIADMMRTKIQTMSEDELSAFYDFSREYYYEDKTAFGLPATFSADAVMWDYGFFSDIYGKSFPDAAYDLRTWITAVATYSREQFEAKYGSSARMMSKFDALADIVENLGYVLR